METIRVVLADDHPYLRSGVRSHLMTTPDIVVVGEAADGVEALRLVAELTPDVLVLDVEMPRLSGIEVATRLHAAGAPVRALVLSAHDDERYFRDLLRSGAAGYLLKDDAATNLVEVIRGVARGERGWFSRRVMTTMTLDPLTAREQEVLRLVAKGLRNKKIAERLVTSQSTVRFHLSNLFGKLQATSRTDLVRRARDRGCLPR